MKQNYQTIDAAVTSLAMPESASVALGDVIADIREGCSGWPWVPGCR